MLPQCLELMPESPCALLACRVGTVRLAKHILKGLGRGCLTAELLTPHELVSSQLLQVGGWPQPAGGDVLGAPSGEGRPRLIIRCQRLVPCAYQ